MPCSTAEEEGMRPKKNASCQSGCHHSAAHCIFDLIIGVFCPATTSSNELGNLPLIAGMLLVPAVPVCIVTMPTGVSCVVKVCRSVATPFYSFSRFRSACSSSYCSNSMKDSSLARAKRPTHQAVPPHCPRSNRLSPSPSPSLFLLHLRLTGNSTQNLADVNFIETPVSIFHLRFPFAYSIFQLPKAVYIINL